MAQANASLGVAAGSRLSKCLGCMAENDDVVLPAKSLNEAAFGLRIHITNFGCQNLCRRVPFVSSQRTDFVP